MDALADFVTIVHLAYFVFVIGGFIAIVGRRSKWFSILGSGSFTCCQFGLFSPKM
jgi:hypothetical protein